MPPGSDGTSNGRPPCRPVPCVTSQGDRIPLLSVSTRSNTQRNSSQCWAVTFTTAKPQQRATTHTQFFSWNATTRQDRRGSPEDAPQAPQVGHSLGYKPLSSSLTARAIASAASTPKPTSLPTASHVSRPNSLSLTNSLYSSHRPPACMAVGATTQMPPSSRQLWTPSCRTNAWILSR